MSGSKRPAIRLKEYRKLIHRPPVSADALSRISGVSARTIRRYDRQTALPQPILSILRLATALGTSVESIIDPEIVKQVRADVTNASGAEKPRTIAAIARRGGTTAIIILADDRVLYVARRKLSRPSETAELQRAIQLCIEFFEVDLFCIEAPERPQVGQSATKVPFVWMTVEAAKQILDLPFSQHGRGRLYQIILERLPALARFARLGREGELLIQEAPQRSLFIAAMLALAADKHQSLYEEEHEQD